MTNYYATSTEYHNDLDAFEARVRAEQEESELDNKLCICLEIIGDNGPCPVHGDPLGAIECSDSSMAAQLNDAGFGSGGIL